MIALLDTNVVSEFSRDRPNQRVVDWLSSLDSMELCLSVVTILEIRIGIEKLDGGRKKNALSRWLDEDLLEEYAGRILPVDGLVADLAARLIMKAKDRSKLQMDALIAATALVYSLPVATLNRDDFAAFGVSVVTF